MHEAAIAQSLLEIIEQQEKQHDARAVTAIVSCGTFNTVNDEALIFALEAITKSSRENIELKIKHKPTCGICSQCKTTFDVTIEKYQCPKCKSDDFELMPDAPLLLEQIEFDED